MDILPTDILPRDLLPSDATPLERELSSLSATLDQIDPAVIETMWNAETCPHQLLPFLAWSLSVDIWDDTWPESTKRQAVAESPAYHRLKGTRASVDMAAALFGCKTIITEWWQKAPPGRRGTATVRAVVTERRVPGAPLVTPTLINQVRQAIALAKPKSRAITLEIGVGVTGEASAGTAASLLQVGRVRAIPSGREAPHRIKAAVAGQALQFRCLAAKSSRMSMLGETVAATVTRAIQIASFQMNVRTQ